MKKLGLCFLVFFLATVCPLTGHTEGPPPISQDQMNALRSFPISRYLTVVRVNGQKLHSFSTDPPVFLFEKSYHFIGFGGCNSISAEFRLYPNQIRFGPLNFTMKKCSSKSNQRELEILFILEKANRWEMVGNRLQMTGPSGSLLLVPTF